jgi:hypothetical protein
MSLHVFERERDLAMTHSEPGTSDPILDLARVRDPIGVLTVLVSLVPGSRSEAFPGHRLVRDALADLDDDARRMPDGDMVEACRRRREEITELVGSLLDGHETGRGRVLVLPLTGSPRRLNVWEGLPDGVVLAVDAHVTPLLALREQGRPTGLVAVSPTGLVAAERSMGVVRTVLSVNFADASPGEVGPQGTEQSVPHQETERHLQSRTFGRRLTNHYAAAIATHSATVAEFAASSGWWAVAICGEPALTAPLQSRLAGTAHEVITSKITPGDGWSIHDLEQALRPEIEHAARVRRAAIAARALDAARARHGTAALGIDDVLEALIEGRVHHLVVAPNALPTTYEQMPDGRLAAVGELPAGALHGRMRRLPGLCDRMVAEAILHDGQITAVGVDESPELAAAGGAVALLRG